MIYSITTDNGANMVKVVSSLSNYQNKEKEIYEDMENDAEENEPDTNQSENSGDDLATKNELNGVIALNNIPEIFMSNKI